MPQIPESCYERDERRIVLLLPAVWEREQGHISRSGGVAAEGVSGGDGLPVPKYGPAREGQRSRTRVQGDDDEDDDVIRNLQSAFVSLVQDEATILHALCLHAQCIFNDEHIAGNISEAMPITLDHEDFRLCD